MSEAQTVDAVRVQPSSTFRRVLGVAVVAATVGGAMLLPSPSRTPFEGARELVAEAYATGEAEQFVERWDPRFTAQFEDRDQLVLDVGGLLSQGSRVEGERVAVVRNVPLVVVQTTEGINWCVRPDGTILPTCRLGEVDVKVDALALGATAELLGGGLDLDRAEIAFELRSTSDETIVLDGPGELVGETGPWTIGAVTQAAGGQFFPPAEDGTLSLGGPFTLQVTLNAALDGVGGWDPQVLTWAVGDTEIRITIPGPRYWLT